METMEIDTQQKAKPEIGYLSHEGFTSEIFKIEIKGLPKYYGFSEIKKLVNVTLKLQSNKIKIPGRNSNFAFICFKSEEDRATALKTLDGYKWKGQVLKALYANPAEDPLVKKRKMDSQNDSRDYNKKPRTVAEGSEALGSLPYEEQLAVKQKKIEDVMLQFKKDLKKANNHQKWTNTENNDEPICELRKIIGSPLIEGYRNKCEFTIGRTVEGEVMVGNRLSSYASGCTSVASIEELKMPTDRMKLATKLVREFVIKSEYEPFNTENFEGTFRNLTIRETRFEDGFMMIIGVHPQKMTKDDKEKLQKEFVEFFTEGEGKVLAPTSIYYEEIQKLQSGQRGNYIKHIHGDTHIKETLLGLQFRISPNSFFQANTLAAEKLYETIIELADVKEDTTLLDVCCGIGTIGLCFAKKVKQVYGMEIIPEAITDAKFNAEDNGITNAEFQAGNADDLIYTMVKKAPVGENEKIVAIVDPPRAGLNTKSIIQLRNSRKINKLVYVSCSPAQCIKNYVDLCKNSSKTMKGDPFLPKLAAIVDMFPNTPHCELAVLFERAEVEVPEKTVAETLVVPEIVVTVEDDVQVAADELIECDTLRNSMEEDFESLIPVINLQLSQGQTELRVKTVITKDGEDGFTENRIELVKVQKPEICVTRPFYRYKPVADVISLSVEDVKTAKPLADNCWQVFDHPFRKVLLYGKLEVHNHFELSDKTVYKFLLDDGTASITGMFRITKKNELKVSNQLGRLTMEKNKLKQRRLTGTNLNGRFLPPDSVENLTILKNMAILNNAISKNIRHQRKQFELGPVDEKALVSAFLYIDKDQELQLGILDLWLNDQIELSWKQHLHKIYTNEYLKKPAAK